MPNSYTSVLFSSLFKVFLHSQALLQKLLDLELEFSTNTLWSRMAKRKKVEMRGPENKREGERSSFAPLSSLYTCVICLLFPNGQFGWFRERRERVIGRIRTKGCLPGNFALHLPLLTYELHRANSLSLHNREHHVVTRHSTSQT